MARAGRQIVTDRLFPETDSVFNRRRFMAISAAAALAPAAILKGLASDTLPDRRKRLLQLNGYAIDAETPLDLLDSYLTPNDLFFIRHHWVPTAVDLANWALVVDGEVATPLRLSLADLKKLPKTSVTCVLQCAGNGRGLFDPHVPGVQWKFGAVGNARWTGVRVREILTRAGLKPAAKHLHAFGSDEPPLKVPRFDRSLEIEKALADAIVAYEMNDKPLPFEHGAPARLVVPGWAGDHWMKWLSRLSAAEKPQTGFYMDTAYRYPIAPGEPGVTFKPEEMTPVTSIFVKSNFTQAPSRARIGSKVPIRGIAFSGAPDIAKVEISDDGGRSWKSAELDHHHDPFAWRFWSFAWTAKSPGSATLLARATDSRGSVQPRAAIWNQSGYLFNGWHSVTIEVAP